MEVCRETVELQLLDVGVELAKDVLVFGKLVLLYGLLRCHDFKSFLVVIVALRQDVLPLVHFCQLLILLHEIGLQRSCELQYAVVQSLLDSGALFGQLLHEVVWLVHELREFLVVFPHGVVLLHECQLVGADLSVAVL